MGIRIVPKPQREGLFGGLVIMGMATIRAIFEEVSLTWLARLGPIQDFLDWRWSVLTLAATLFTVFYVAWFLQENCGMGKKAKRKREEKERKRREREQQRAPQQPTAVRIGGRAKVEGLVMTDNTSTGPINWLDIDENAEVSDVELRRNIVGAEQRVEVAESKSDQILAELSGHFLKYGLILRRRLEDDIYGDIRTPSEIYSTCNTWYSLARKFIEDQVSVEEARLFSSDAGLITKDVEGGTKQQRRHFKTMDGQIQRLQRLIEGQPWK